MMVDESSGTTRLTERAVSGDTDALAQLFLQYRSRLDRMVQMRMDRRLQGRVDPSDVLQEAYIELARRLPDYARQQSLSFFLWARMVTGQRLLQVHRRHLGAAMRNAGRDLTLYAGALPEASSMSLAAHLLGRLTTGSQAAIRVELQLQLQEVLNGMEPIDREVLALRHFEDLTNKEVAQMLGISKAAASKRYVTALRRLREVLSSIPGFMSQNLPGTEA
jgi:RNA polymerase sigma-70 factor (ECF subfamily)